MKILHTSDWHLGQEFYSYDRIEEHQAFFDQLKQIVEEEQPDVLVISGDIYHNATPSNAVMRFFTDNLDQIRCASREMQIVAIAGNHDSSSRLEVNRSLWEHLGVHVVGKIENTENEVDFNKLIFPITNSDSELKGYVVAIPYTSVYSYPAISENTARDERMAEFMKAVQLKVNEINIQNVPVVMLLHLALTGSDITGHNDNPGGMDYINLSDIHVDYDYLALGHIHCPQNLKSDDERGKKVRYCGSPVPVNFDEKYVHSVSIVEIEKHSSLPTIRTIPVHNPWPLITLPNEPVEFEQAIKELEEFPDHKAAYIRLHVKLNDVAPQHALEKAASAVANKTCRFCTFKWEKDERINQNNCAFSDVEQMKSHSPLEIAEMYYLNKYGQKLDDQLKSMLSRVIEDVERSKQQ